MCPSSPASTLGRGWDSLGGQGWCGIEGRETGQRWGETGAKEIHHLCAWQPWEQPDWRQRESSDGTRGRKGELVRVRQMGASGTLPLHITGRPGPRAVQRWCVVHERTGSFSQGNLSVTLTSCCLSPRLGLETFFLFLFFNFLAAQQGMWYLSSLVRNRTHVPCSGSSES